MTIQFSLSRNSITNSSLPEKFGTYLTSVKQFTNSVFYSLQSGSTASFDKATTAHQLRRQFKKNKFFFIPVGVIVLLLIISIVYMVRSANSGGVSVAGAADQRIELKKPLATQTLNKTFAFPLKDEKGKEVSKIQYTLETAELRDEIIVKGQRATSVKGRTFLVIPVKITNTFNAPVEINARDYVRLVVNNNTKDMLAPDIHNDPVEVQAISTKHTRIGFPIDDNTKSLVLQVGEINGKKENITLTLKK